MGRTRICVGAFMVHALSGCDGRPLTAEMHRVSDGAKTICMTGVYNPLFGDAGVRRILNACILACRKRGFVEDGEATQIDERSSVLKPEEGWGNAPTICRG
jgi:hypothetical protein